MRVRGGRQAGMDNGKQSGVVGVTYQTRLLKGGGVPKGWEGRIEDMSGLALRGPRKR